MKRLIVFTFGIAVPIILSAATPRTITYQGRLVESGVLANGSRSVQFDLYASSSSSSNMFTETDSVLCNDGLFSTTLGDSDANAFANALAGGEAWLQVSVDGTAMGDRERLIAVPYAAHADSANFLQDNGMVGGRIVADSILGEPRPIVIMGSASNTVGAAYGSTISGGYDNAIGNYSDYAAIGGGYNNAIGNYSDYAAIGGGYNNAIGDDAYAAAIGGGWMNDIGNDSSEAVIGGGYWNNIGDNAFAAAIGGGAYNDIGNDSKKAVIGGGAYNDIGTNSEYAVTAGGKDCDVGDNAPYAFVAGRRAKANHEGAFVWADSTNEDFASASSNQFLIRAEGGVGIGTNVTPEALTVAGNVQADEFIGSGAGLTGIGGGSLTAGSISNVLLAADSITSVNINDGTIAEDDLAPDSVTSAKIENGTVTVADIAANTFWTTAGNSGTTAETHFLGTTDEQAFEVRVDGARAMRIEPALLSPNVIFGSDSSTIATGLFATTISGGFDNDIGTDSEWTTIGGGTGNKVEQNAASSTIAGGSGNVIGHGSQRSTIAGGGHNSITTDASYSTIGGGASNDIGEGAEGSTIGGGSGLVIGENSLCATIAGGCWNVIRDDAGYATIGGGWWNIITNESSYATISGGFLNKVGTNSRYATIPGGYDCGIGDNAYYAFATGYRAKANHGGTFVWSDSTDEDFASSARNQFLIRAAGGVGIGTTSPDAQLEISAAAPAVRIDAASEGKSGLQLYETTGGNPYGYELQYDGSEDTLHLWSRGFTGNEEMRMTWKKDGDVGIGTTAPLTKFDVERIISAAETPENHVAFIRNNHPGDNGDLLALRSGYNSGEPGTGVNFITFFNSTNNAIGRVEGNGSGGVSYNTSGSDYAEYFPLSAGAQPPAAGEVVGIVDGKVVPDAEQADRFMAVSDRAAVVGNSPGEDTSGYALVCFLGQLPVRVSGRAVAGDFIIAGTDGCGVAIPAVNLTEADLGRLIGQALESAPDSGVKRVNTLIGLTETACRTALRNELAKRDALISRLANEASQRDQAIAELSARIQSLEEYEDKLGGRHSAN